MDVFYLSIPDPFVSAFLLINFISTTIHAPGQFFQTQEPGNLSEYPLYQHGGSVRDQMLLGKPGSIVYHSGIELPTSKMQMVSALRQMIVRSNRKTGPEK